LFDNKSYFHVAKNLGHGWFYTVHLANLRLTRSTVEPVFGIIKEIMGFRRFMLRGLEAIKGEWLLVCMAFNLKRLCVLNF